MEDPPISDQEQNKETILFKSSDAYNEMMMKLREMLGTYGINLDKALHTNPPGHKFQPGSPAATIETKKALASKEPSKSPIRKSQATSPLASPVGKRIKLSRSSTCPQTTEDSGVEQSHLQAAGKAATLEALRALVQELHEGLKRLREMRGLNESLLETTLSRVTHLRRLQFQTSRADPQAREIVDHQLQFDITMIPILKEGQGKFCEAEERHIWVINFLDETYGLRK